MILFELEKAEIEMNEVFISLVVRRASFCLKTLNKKRGNKEIKKVISTILILGISQMNPTIAFRLFFF